VKGAKFTVRELLDDEELAARFAGGAMVISRLCPVDYHRFHFPAAGVPRESRLVQGWLYSVSPIALRAPMGSITPVTRGFPRMYRRAYACNCAGVCRAISSMYRKW